jgi:hypothetical protein
MSFNIHEIKSQLEFGGARPSLFQVRLLNPGSGVGDLKLPFMCKAASLPASTLGEIPVPYFGRNIKVGGVRTYENWSITIINDEDFLVRKAMETWSKRINTYIGNTRDFTDANPENYKARAEVVQYGQVGNVLRAYQFEGIFPLNIGAIQTSWAEGDQIEEFTVDFAVDYWAVSGEPTTP